MPTKPSIPTKSNGDLFQATELNTIVDFFEQKSDISSSMGIVTHADDPNVTRPDDYICVTWIGSVEPINATDNDIWYNTVPATTSTTTTPYAGSIPVIAGSGTFITSDDPERAYTVDLTSAPNGSLMMVGLYNSTTVTNYTPPVDWDVVHNAPGINIYSKIKEPGETTFDFVSDSSSTNGVASFYITGATYVDETSLTIGTSTSTTSSSGKTISGISLTGPALVIAFATGGNASPTVISSGFTLHDEYPDYFSPFRYVTVYEKNNIDATTGNVDYTLPGTTPNAGILIAVYS